MSSHLVVARYQEDVKWVLKAVRDGAVTRAFVMNKGMPLMPLNSGDENVQDVQDVQDIPLPNYGLDQYCHLQYIVRNYEALALPSAPDVVCFVQAGVSDHYDVYEHELAHEHAHDLHSKIKTINVLSKEAAGIVDESDFVKRLVDQARRSPEGCSFNARIYLHGGEGPNRLLVTSGEFRCPDEWNEKSTGKKNLREWFEEYVDPDFPKDHLRWWKNAIFAVQTRKILGRPKAYYERLSNLMEGERRGEVLHYMERVWFYVLGCN